MALTRNSEARLTLLNLCLHSTTHPPETDFQDFSEICKKRSKNTTPSLFSVDTRMVKQLKNLQKVEFAKYLGVIQLMSIKGPTVM